MGYFCHRFLFFNDVFEREYILISEHFSCFIDLLPVLNNSLKLLTLLSQTHYLFMEKHSIKLFRLS